MTEIPVAYAEQRNGKLLVGPYVRDGVHVTVADPVPAAGVDRLKTRECRGTVVVVDSAGVSSGEFDPYLVESCRVPGNDVWLVEAVRDEADVLDAFLGYLAKLVMPARVMGPGLLEGARDLSDDCVPMVEVLRGSPVGIRGSLRDYVRRADDLGYRKTVVADLDGSLTTDDWHMLKDASEGVVPYAPVSESAVPGVFETRLTDLFGPAVKALRRTRAPSPRTPPSRSRRTRAAGAPRPTPTRRCSTGS